MLGVFDAHRRAGGDARSRERSTVVGPGSYASAAERLSQALLLFEPARRSMTSQLSSVATIEMTIAATIASHSPPTSSTSRSQSVISSIRPLITNDTRP